MKKWILCVLALCLLLANGCGKRDALELPKAQAQALLTELQKIPGEELEFTLKHEPITPDAPHMLVSPGRAAGARSGTVIHTAGPEETELVRSSIESMELISVEQRGELSPVPGVSHPRLSVFAGDERQSAAYFRVITAGHSGWGRLECDIQVEDVVWTASYSVDNVALEKLYAALWAD